MNKVYLLPGEVFANRKPHIIDTVLGSCIAVVLWDCVLHFGSINHFMLPKCSSNAVPSNKYGDIAIFNIIQKMLQLGSHKGNLKAKVFGGSITHHNNGIFQIGQRNTAIAFELLKAENIPVISHSVGGNESRKIVFYSDTGDVLVKFMRPAKQEALPSLKTNTNHS